MAEPPMPEREWIQLNERMRIRLFKESLVACLWCGWSVVTEGNGWQALRDHYATAHPKETP